MTARERLAPLAARLRAALADEKQRVNLLVCMGLAGLFLVSDDDEAALALPSGAFDMPLVIQDRNFDQDNQLVYPGSAMAAADARQIHGTAVTGTGSIRALAYPVLTYTVLCAMRRAEASSGGKSAPVLGLTSKRG